MIIFPLTQKPRYDFVNLSNQRLGFHRFSGRVSTTRNATNLQKRVLGVRDKAKKYPDIKILDAYDHKETPQYAAAKVEQMMQPHFP